MNKLLTKIVGAALGLAMTIGVGVMVGNNTRESAVAKAAASGSEEAYSYTFTSKQFSDNSTAKTLGGVTWTPTTTWTEGTYWGYDGTKGQQWGSGSAQLSSVTITSGVAFTDVTDVIVNASIAKSGGCKLTTKVGSTTIGSEQTLTTTATAYDQQNTSGLTGAVSITLTSSKKKAQYIKSIEIWTKSSSGKTETATTIIAANEKTLLDVTADNPKDSVQLTATAKVGNDTVTSLASNFTWTSSKESVATVSSAGVVSAVAKGMTTVSASYKGDDTHAVSSGQISIFVVDPNEAEFNFADLATANSWENGEAYTTVVFNNTTLTATGGGNNGKYYISDKTWRMYNGGSLTITPPSGKSISSITSDPSCSFTIANDGSSATASITATTNFSSITVSLAAEKVLDTITAVVTNSQKVWRVNDEVYASDLTVTPHYTDGTDGTPITDGTGVTVTNGTLTLVGDNTVNVSYGGKPTTVTVNALSSTVVAWTITGSIGETVKTQAYNLSGLTLHAWYDSGKTDEASSSVAALYELVANPTTAGSTSDPLNTITVEVYLKTDTGHENKLAEFTGVAAPIIDSPKGSVDNPYTSTEAVAAVLAYGSTSASSDTYYAYGYVKKINGKNLWIVDDPDLIGANNEPADTDCLQCYASANWTNVALGDRIVVSGKMQVYSSKAEFSSSVITDNIPETMTLSKTLAAETLTINSSFSYGGVVSIDYTHKTDVANANALVSFKVGGQDVDMSTVGNKTVTISYSDEVLGKDASTTYTLTVEYAAVTTVTLNHHNITVEPNSDINFSVALNNNVDPSSAATWNVANDVGSSLNLSKYTVSSTGNLSGKLESRGDSTDNGTLIVTATVGGVSDTCTVRVTGDAYVTFNKESVDGIVDSTAGNTVKATPVGLGTPISYSWSITSGSNVASVTGNTDTATLTFKAVGTATLHVVISDGSDTAEGDITVNVIRSLNPISIPGKTTEYNDSLTFSSVCTVDATYDDTTIDDADEFDVYFNKGTNSNEPVYKTTGSAIRVYGGGYFTVSSSHTLTKIELTFGSGDNANAITTNVGEFDTNTWTGSSTSVTFTIGGTSGHRRIAGVKIYWEVTSSDTPVANTNYNAQKAVIEFAEDLTSKLNAVCLKGEGGTTVVSSLNSAWTNIKKTYDDKREALSSTDCDVFDALIANATADESGDVLQKALRSYEWVYAKYHASLTAGDFLHETSGRGEVSYSPIVTSNNILGSSNESVIIVLISLISLAGIGVVFYKRKRQSI